MVFGIGQPQWKCIHEQACGHTAGDRILEESRLGTAMLETFQRHPSHSPDAASLEGGAKEQSRDLSATTGVNAEHGCMLTPLHSTDSGNPLSHSPLLL